MCRQSYDYGTSIRRLRVYFEEDIDADSDQAQIEAESGGSSEKEGHMDEHVVETAVSGDMKEDENNEVGNRIQVDEGISPDQ
ncbi:hypothetical protein V5O48_006545 [Marasmius crinis-equi]|uniref:Uncharacterized protein n=1 Tax=Marasmius crinis-equi TaxID=585013 RepID=A0ABR3FJT2_9AGAR